LAAAAAVAACDKEDQRLCALYEKLQAAARAAEATDAAVQAERHRLVLAVKADGDPQAEGALAAITERCVVAKREQEDLATALADTDRKRTALQARRQAAVRAAGLAELARLGRLWTAAGAKADAHLSAAVAALAEREEVRLQMAAVARQHHLDPHGLLQRTDPVSRFLVTMLGRQDEGAENATVNRELALLKRAFSLAMKSTPPKVTFRPHVPMLEEDNTV
jgi:hypothetical protein